MLLVLIFVIYLTWSISKGVNGNAEQSGLTVHPSNYKKQPIEMMKPVKQELENTGRTIHLLDYMDNKQRLEKYHLPEN